MGEPFRVVPLGVGDTFSERYRTTALLLTCDGVTLAVDCPDRYREALRAASAPALSDIDHVLVTHVHGDHMNGLEGVAFFKRFAQDRRVQLVTSREVRDVIWEHRLRAPMERLWDGERFTTLGFDDYFVHEELSWTKETVVGPFRVRARMTKHHVPTSAILVTAGGRTLGYSSDTAFDPELIAFLEPADLIIHETNLGPAHTPYERLAALPAELRAKMRIIHYPDALDLATSVVVPAREGERLEV